jgi:hypothetical protein
LTHTSGTIKVAVLLLYTHHITSPRFKIAANTVGFASIMYQVVFSLTALFQCRPIHAFWDLTINGSCIDFHSQLIAACVLDVIINSVVLCLPMSMLWSKTTLTRVRGALAAVFVLGCTVVFAGIYRLSKVFAIYHSDIPGQSLNHSFTQFKSFRIIIIYRDTNGNVPMGANRMLAGDNRGMHSVYCRGLVCSETTETAWIKVEQCGRRPDGMELWLRQRRANTEKGRPPILREQ